MPKTHQFSGSKVGAFYKGKKIFGTVGEEVQRANRKMWKVKFDDGFSTFCNESKLRSWLLPAKRSFKQLDHILVSQRWMSCVTNCKSDWSPSIHRSKWGIREDHALVCSTWKWRLRSIDPPSGVDYSALAISTETYASRFNDEFARYPVDPEDHTTPSVCTRPSADPTDGDQDSDNSDPGNRSAVSSAKYRHWQKAAAAAAKAVLPPRQSGILMARDVSEKTRNLLKQRESMKKNSTSSQFSDIQQAIKQSSLEDYKNWVNERVREMEIANTRNDSRKVFAIVNQLSRKPKPPPQNITADKQGNLLESAEQAAEIWLQFLKDKFDSTDAERTRPMPDIPSERSPTSGLTRKEFDEAIKRMSNNKAAGPDGIPVEAIKYCSNVRNALFEIINIIWEQESVPDGFVKAKFTMLYKKGPVNDPGNYRCIALLNHAYKILAQIMLARLTEQCDACLKDWQAGFRKSRGTRDNITILRTLCKDVLRLGKSLTINFVDYAAAFDSVSHKFLDGALARAGASNKMRAMVRAVYESASAFTTVPDAEGKQVKTDEFRIKRGVLQGDIMSPLFFIIALEFILRKYDNVDGKGVSLGSTRIHTLAYADDLALTDEGDTEGVHRATTRATSISTGSRCEADMKVKIVKTKVLHVRAQDPVGETTDEEASSVSKFVCPHLNCGFRFFSKRGMLAHASRCEWKNEFEVERILSCRGPLCSRQFKIRWKGYLEEDDTWENRTNLHPEAIKDFETVNNLYDHNWLFQCPVCDLPCKSARGVKIHRTKAHGKNDKTVQNTQNFKGRLADRAVVESKLVDQQSSRPNVLCEGEPLENVFRFPYLGAIFAADGLQGYDIRARIGKAMTRCGKLGHMFDSPDLGPRLKIRLYNAAVVSLLTYGCESWNLTQEVMRKLNGCNSQMLARITGRSVREEARSTTSSFDLVKAVRVRRLRWLGQILRGDPTKLLFATVVHQYHNRSSGDLFMDVPNHGNLDDLIYLASDKIFWKSQETSIPSHLRGITIYNRHDM